MKVLHFYRTYYPDSFGGVEQVIRQMVNGSARLGIDAEVLTLTRDRNNLELEFEGHQVHRAPLNLEIASTGFSWSALGRFKQLAASADIIHYHFPWPFMDLAHFACGIDKPSVLTYHSDIVRQKHLFKLYQPLQNQFLQRVNKIVATSPNYMATSPTLAKFSGKTEVITYGLDESIYPQPSPGVLQKWRDRFPEPFFLFVGMLRYYKGLHVLLEAASGTSIPIVILGDGPVEAELKKQAQHLCLNNVHFLGALPEIDKVALMQACYGLAFPSHLRSEAFGITLLEAAMFGKPMISCEIGTGTSYVNLHEKTGLVVPASDPRAFRQAMQFLLAHPQRAAEMGQQAYQRYQSTFTALQMAQSYRKLYQSLI
ncbi:glycosyltransferase family 4 protein [Undibacterium fentianense]|uniref:Glycosyltransferase family 4 protein n=1 Tax=Undibacterium fentianense TaxID=2828728 RepID=A0A941IEU4_9BURK|nr:glycosyltransferase family 4 protein [Undibacterium fentianense]MBR7801483.1 glycosyltransferase family 4 protein [Undibacterium fentianense]